MKRLVMLSGGVDSSVLLYKLRKQASGEAPCGVCAPCIAREEAFALADAKALVR